ncbi:SET domain-containing protein-lysine N-methyltransferase [Candidatus Woesearchaeota archaeon]|nr:SET domain-containing protein-lysine N-methyltransferase [Candidatus Woesearchaeota archaeon]
MADILVKKSKIHGRGIFAARDFKKGEIVIKYDTSNTLTKEEVDKLPEAEKRYVSYLGEDKYILHQPPARYVNHSCDANTYSDNFADIARRDIKKGEEITADYVAEKVPGFDKVLCKCGSKNCRSVIKTSS